MGEGVLLTVDCFVLMGPVTPSMESVSSRSVQRGGAAQNVTLVSTTNVLNISLAVYKKVYVMLLYIYEVKIKFISFDFLRLSLENKVHYFLPVNCITFNLNFKEAGWSTN